MFFVLIQPLLQDLVELPYRCLIQGLHYRVLQVHDLLHEQLAHGCVLVRLLARALLLRIGAWTQIGASDVPLVEQSVERDLSVRPLWFLQGPIHAMPMFMARLFMPIRLKGAGGCSYCAGMVSSISTYVLLIFEPRRYLGRAMLFLYSSVVGVVVRLMALLLRGLIVFL